MENDRRKIFLTDVSTAARTMLFNIRDMDWDRELLDIIGVPRSILADIMPTSGDFGTTDKEAFCGVSIKITASMVDQPALYLAMDVLNQEWLKILMVQDVSYI